VRFTFIFVLALFIFLCSHFWVFKYSLFLFYSTNQVPQVKSGVPPTPPLPPPTPPFYYLHINEYDFKLWIFFPPTCPRFIYLFYWGSFFWDKGIEKKTGIFFLSVNLTNHAIFREIFAICLITLNWKKTHLKSPAHAMSHLVFFFLFKGSRAGRMGWQCFGPKLGKLWKKNFAINLVNFSIFGNLCQFFYRPQNWNKKAWSHCINMKIVWIFSHIFMWFDRLSYCFLFILIVSHCKL